MPGDGALPIYGKNIDCALKLFFFEKKNQKTFDLFRSFVLAPYDAPERIKVFLLLFLQKKKTYSRCAIGRTGTPC